YGFEDEFRNGVRIVGNGGGQPGTAARLRILLVSCWSRPRIRATAAVSPSKGSGPVRWERPRTDSDRSRACCSCRSSPAWMLVRPISIAAFAGCCRVRRSRARERLRLDRVELSLRDRTRVEQGLCCLDLAGRAAAP